MGITTLDKKLKNTLEQDSWLNLPDGFNEENIFNPLLNIPEGIEDNAHLYMIWLMTQPEYFSFITKYVFNLDLSPMQLCILKEIWNRKFPMLIGSRGLSKTFLMAVYCLLRLILIPNRKMVIAGAAFRQSKFVFEYMETIWKNAPVLRDMIGGSGGPSRDVDMWRFRIFDSIGIFIPIGTGETIRGLRANDIIMDEFSAANREIFETVISGFGAVSSSPIENVKNLSARKRAIKLGIWNEDSIEDTKLNTKANQIIISGTAYYDFNHFAHYWKTWHKIIESKGDKDKMIGAFGNEDKYDKSIDYRDFSIIRIPFEVIPEGFMDAAQVARSKATFDAGTYLMEFGACLKPGTKIITDCGVREIQDITTGDKVLTHNGSFEKVLKTTYRNYSGQLIKYKTSGCYDEVEVTPDHLFWIDNEWEEIQNINGSTQLVRLNTLNNIYEINTEDYCSNYWLDNEGYLYPVIKNSKVDQKTREYIKSSSYTKKELSNELGLSYGTVQRTLNCEPKRTKGAIPSKIKLDYDFGLIIGYYAAEGSCGSDNRNVGFALDGHVNTKCISYVTQLKKAMFDSLNITPKVYERESVSNVSISSVLLVQLIKNICPGVANTKVINPDILYSNKEFLKGFIVGYWNGDGHIPENKNTNLVSSSVSLNLSVQIRTVLSYFGVIATIGRKKPGTSVLRNKKHNTRASYHLTINGDSKRTFLREFYGIIIDEKKPVSKKVNDSNFELKIKNKEYIDYDGFVYNLEVANYPSYSTLNSTVHNCFLRDSNGFFKRSLVESCCVTHETDFTNMPKNVEVFPATLYGKHSHKYVYGIDPASEVDNFAIVILEIHENHRRIVHCWTINKKGFKEKVKAGVVKENDYYQYCCVKIRELMEKFPTDHIAIDTQGGGYAILEGLQSKDQKDGHVPILPMINPAKPKDTDGENGLHIMELVQFASLDYTRDANHGLRKDLEDKTILFPYFDAVSIADTNLDEGSLYDSLEDCIMDIEELKDELASIIVTETSSGRQRWDTPETKVSGNKKGRARKDRYSALIMANMLARSIKPKVQMECTRGGFAANVKPGEGPLYVGPSWFTNKIGGVY